VSVLSLEGSEKSQEAMPRSSRERGDKLIRYPARDDALHHFNGGSSECPSDNTDTDKTPSELTRGLVLPRDMAPDQRLGPRMASPASIARGGAAVVCGEGRAW
jgi:hypothetical protein